MQALGLRVEDGVRVDDRALMRLDKARQTLLVFVLDLVKPLAEAASSAKGKRSERRCGSRRQAVPMASSSNLDRPGLACISQRRWVMPLVMETNLRGCSMA